MKHLAGALVSLTILALTYGFVAWCLSGAVTQR